MGATVHVFTPATKMEMRMSQPGLPQPPEFTKMENPVFLFLFRIIVPILLGAILTIAFSINSAQMEQGKQISQMQGQLGVIAQQNTDAQVRLGKVEEQADETSKALGVLAGRVLVLESKNQPKP